MALFQKKPVVTSGTPAYTIGAHKTILVIGLGNPEPKYDATRHNVGFMVLDEFAIKNDFGPWINKKDLKCQLTSATMGDARVILIKPTTYMNNSGGAAQAVQHFYRIYNHGTLAVYDEVDIPFGTIRTRLGGSDAGHNGVKSLINHIGGDFGRLRIGIGSEEQKTKTASYVLSKFTKAEQSNLQQVMKEANAVITEFIFGGQLQHETRNILN